MFLNIAVAAVWVEVIYVAMIILASVGIAECANSRKFEARKTKFETMSAKFEYRNSKYETISNIEIKKISNCF
ncbi:MAG: hypothetical protein A2817_00645 [Candidatus Yanofskybacteria bacterium RIFCSPHIGHO2_01_FULL_39_8b]|uniref:Uncharacterized protein n=1 Tax=Candidatus Yanofskybacteria bacterium RIFCSPHIGHO2_01_FULL_39_8b TaxID=1802659 RepID=A0A1F8EB97_9BACT|nr:MAG: hypothetical protein A2817_00645 [Candidatus Yanofskybacteria bacterium RIFCSPHIGHO2_01_FULL_39_8b]